MGSDVAYGLIAINSLNQGGEALLVTTLVMVGVCLVAMIGGYGAKNDSASPVCGLPQLPGLLHCGQQRSGSLLPSPGALIH